ncbi:hypothetical protein V8C86DRAFT_3023849 [Haematococcus lacustris]
MLTAPPRATGMTEPPLVKLLRITHQAVARAEELPTAGTLHAQLADLQAVMMEHEEAETMPDSMLEWMSQIQTFILAFQHDIQQHRNVYQEAEDSSPGPSSQQFQQARCQAWHLLMQCAAGILACTMDPEGDGTSQSSVVEVLDGSSCSSSTCGSSHPSTSSTTASSSITMCTRLVAVRSRLRYNTHWARKPAL